MDFTVTVRMVENLGLAGRVVILSRTASRTNEKGLFLVFQTRCHITRKGTRQIAKLLFDRGRIVYEFPNLLGKPSVTADRRDLGDEKVFVRELNSEDLRHLIHGVPGDYEDMSR
jgi:hypothetical protein